MDGIRVKKLDEYLKEAEGAEELDKAAVTAPVTPAAEVVGAAVAPDGKVSPLATATPNLAGNVPAADTAAASAAELKAAEVPGVVSADTASATIAADADVSDDNKPAAAVVTNTNYPTALVANAPAVAPVTGPVPAATDDASAVATNEAYYSAMKKLDTLDLDAELNALSESLKALAEEDEAKDEAKPEDKKDDAAVAPAEEHKKETAPAVAAPVAPENPTPAKGESMNTIKNAADVEDAGLNKNNLSKTKTEAPDQTDMSLAAQDVICHIKDAEDVVSPDTVAAIKEALDVETPEGANPMDNAKGQESSDVADVEAKKDDIIHTIKSGTDVDNAVDVNAPVSDETEKSVTEALEAAADDGEADSQYQNAPAAQAAPEATAPVAATDVVDHKLDTTDVPEANAPTAATETLPEGPIDDKPLTPEVLEKGLDAASNPATAEPTAATPVAAPVTAPEAKPAEPADNKDAEADAKGDHAEPDGDEVKPVEPADNKDAAGDAAGDHKEPDGDEKPAEAPKAEEAKTDAPKADDEKKDDEKKEDAPEYASVKEAISLGSKYFNSDPAKKQKLTEQIALTIAAQNNDRGYAEYKRLISEAEVIRESLVYKYGVIAKNRTGDLLESMNPEAVKITPTASLLKPLTEDVEVVKAKQKADKTPLDDNKVIFR
jgi:hypothetical protein